MINKSYSDGSTQMARYVRTSLGKRNDPRKDIETLIKDLCASLDAAEAERDRLAKALRAAIDDISEYIGYSYADEYRAALAEMDADLIRLQRKGQEQDKTP